VSEIIPKFGWIKYSTIIITLGDVFEHKLGFAAS